MANTHISDIPFSSTANTTDLVEVQQAAGPSKSVNVASLVNSCFPTVLTANPASTSVFGAVKKAAAVDPSTLSFSNPPTQAECLAMKAWAVAFYASIQAAGLMT